MGRTRKKSISDGTQANLQEGQSTTGKSLSKKKHRLGAQVRARKVAAGLVKGLSTRQAMLAAGFSESTARHSGGSNAIMERIRDQLALELDRQIPRDKLVERLLDLALNAKHTETFLDKQTGQVVYSEPMDDNLSRIKATELLGRFLGALVTRTESKVETLDVGEEVRKARERLNKLAALPEPQPDINAEVIDACNGSEKRREPWQQPGAKFHLVDTPEATCIMRAKSLGDEIIVPIIERMAQEFTAPEAADLVDGPSLG